MSKKIIIISLLAFILLLNGCSDEWNDLVDSISGSGDDNPAPVEEEVAAAPEAATEQNVTEEAVIAIVQATDEAAPESKATAEVATESKATAEAAPKPKVTDHFHHTTTASSDGGKSLVMCPGHVPNFDKCSVGDTDIPFHGYDNGRVIYWNMFDEPRGDIICVKNGKRYRYKANSTVVYGNCD
ncbi:MAG: hypothetical protein KJO28_11925 [Desulfofustis sp.]|nr:hypothetical protein [Desulfofustis sp.]NNK57579.1 hypothetical protein [Desulfofustis sp.]